MLGMDAARMLYGLINLTCALIILLEMCGCIREGVRSERSRAITAAMAAMCLSFLFDMIDGFGSMYEGLDSRLGFFIVCCYDICMAFGVYFGFIFSELCQEEKYIKRRAVKLLLLVSVLAVAILDVTGQLFTYDEAGYHVGRLYFVEVIILYGMLIFTGLKAAIKSGQNINYARKDEYRVLAGFMFIPAVFELLQLLLGPDAPMITIGITLCFIVIYQTHLEKQISKDFLTGLDNRTHFLNYISAKMAGHEQNLYLLMIDGDSFKKINDTYGHTEGDIALVQIADALRTAVPRDFLIARYGGDEFVVVGEADSAEMVGRIIDNINRELEARNSTNGREWDVYVSIGCAEHTPDIETIPDFINAADREMYRVKNERKSAQR